MANELLVKNINNGNVEKFIRQKGIINNLEIQKFKSNVLAISNQYGLDKAYPETIINSCYQAVLLNLPLEKNFGYCYIVPYWDNNTKVNNAQFQMGYKGYIQLALRSQQYKEINVSDVRLTEIKKIDRLKGIEFNWIQDDLERLKQPIIGYVAYFQLVNGFEKTLYMSNEQIEKHFLKYSKTYAKNKEFIVSDFDSMSLKTVLTQLLRKWGIMSTEMQIAYESDQAIITETEKIYIDNPNNNIEIENNNNFQKLEENINKLDNLVFKNE
ncbi:recombinase RecT [Spiroplasma endosymbiont of Melieria omissa]|uniref:recombinase RecT n=1 Tax=Spiroplasma endosymbiont of Melieria omissa TaxID=3139324 RepID=UPI003CCAC3BD